MKDTGFTAEVVRWILSRARGCCERCGRHVVNGPRGRAWSIHHRAPRGMGGSSSGWRNAASSGLLLCGHGTAGCHGWVESHRDESYALGLLVRMGERPLDTPVTLRGGRVVRLSDAGEYLPLAASLSAVPASPGAIRVAWSL